jgi:hypothetical protein
LLLTFQFCKLGSHLIEPALQTGDDLRIAAAAFAFTSPLFRIQMAAVAGTTESRFAEWAAGVSQTVGCPCMSVQLNYESRSKAPQMR